MENGAAAQQWSNGLWEALCIIVVPSFWDSCSIFDCKRQVLAATNWWRRTSGGRATFGYVESTVPRKNSAGTPEHHNRFGSVKRVTRNGFQINQLQSSSGVRETVEAKLEIQMALMHSSMTFWLRCDVMMQSSRCNGSEKDKHIAIAPVSFPREYTRLLDSQHICYAKMQRALFLAKYLKRRRVAPFGLCSRDFGPCAGCHPDWPRDMFVTFEKPKPRRCVSWPDQRLHDSEENELSFIYRFVCSFKTLSFPLKARLVLTSMSPISMTSTLAPTIEWKNRAVATWPWSSFDGTVITNFYSIMSTIVPVVVLPKCPSRSVKWSLVLLVLRWIVFICARRCVLLHRT